MDTLFILIISVYENPTIVLQMVVLHDKMFNSLMFKITTFLMLMFLWMIY